MQGAAEYLELIKKPLRFAIDANEDGMDRIKNLGDHIVKISLRALGAGLQENDAILFRSVHDLFTDFEGLTSATKRERVLSAWKLIESPTSNRHTEVRNTTRCFMPSEHPPVDLKALKGHGKILNKPVQFVKGVGPSLAMKFAKAGVRTVLDLLMFFPTRFEDRRFMTPVGNLAEGVPATVSGTIEFSGVAFYRGLRRRVFEVLVRDETGAVGLKWFHFPMGSMEERFRRGQMVVACGKPRRYKNRMEMHHPDCEVFSGNVDSMSFGRIVPVYREIGGIYQKTLRRILFQAVTQYADHRACILPVKLCRELDLLSPARALRERHFPESIPTDESRSAAERTLAFEELFFYCLSLARRKLTVAARPGISFAQKSPRMERLIQMLPFKLTAAQERVCKMIRRDMEAAKPMNRLLQGDVGSGKTIIAFLASLVAIDHGYQVAFLAPTEILSEQHFRTLSTYAEKVNIKIACLTGHTPSAERKEILKRLETGDLSMIVGTHALLESDIRFSALGLVIVDEQHRFGVRQRARIRRKGIEPDVLVMSATPIPRTLALTLYGDLDVSVLDELPPGRKPIETRICTERERSRVYATIRTQVQLGRQAYVVYPLVEASEKLDAKDATSMAEQFRKDIFPEFRVELIHGQMPSMEKDRLMELFSKGHIQILVSTTVIEVGIDVANATLMIVEHPERFGLSQLHQLRGRVGRGAEKSMCLLIRPRGVSKAADERLRLFAKTQNGFVLAEQDLKLRGPGDFFGTAQSGFPAFQVAQFPRDLDLLERARREAIRILEEDGKLEAPEHQGLLWMENSFWAERIQLVRVG